MLLVRLYDGGPQLQVSNYEQTSNFYLTPTIGLYNEENYSFLNLALQALFSLEIFLIYFLKRKYKNNKEQKLCQIFNQTILEMQSQISQNFYNPIHIKTYVDENNMKNDPQILIEHLLK